MAALIVDDSRDPGRKRESTNLGSTAYLVKPVDAGDLLRRVAAALASRERRRWSRTPVGPNVLVRSDAGRARLLDISYGGVRLESGSVQLPNVLKLELPIRGVSVNAERVWSTEAAGTWSCGAALAAEHSKRWRRVVDTVREGGASLSFSDPWL
jgi:hypothetical protein